MRNRLRAWFGRLLLMVFPSYIDEFIADWFSVYLNKSSTEIPLKDHEYGRQLSYRATDFRVRHANLLRSLADAIVTMPPGTIVSLRERIPTNFGRNKGVAWYTVVGLYEKEKATLIDMDAMRKIIPAGGFIDHGFFITPKKN